MATDSKNSKNAQNRQALSEGERCKLDEAKLSAPAARGDLKRHGTTGEGAVSAMACLISQQEARMGPVDRGDVPPDFH